MIDHAELFLEVANLSPEARLQYFEAHGVDDPTRREVEALLRFDSASGATLEGSIDRVVQRALVHFEVKEMRCGAYCLGDLLGRGGMGSVYSAERADGEVKQRVAVKLLRPGMEDQDLRQRFLAERQILAALSHPNVGRLLDAGHREDGQPYLVMEYVQGQTIDLFAAGHSIRQIITLLRKVCAAVGYLHRNLVVHRDLKPANILVTPEGEPKLLAFGIAKILDLAGDPNVTGAQLLSPDYASPEQISGNPVTTATDIYSLGAVLYKLLTGASPNRSENGSYHAMASAISEGKITSPTKLVPGLDRDVAIILLKALRREPEERYATAEQFSEDLENYLNLRPIQARKGDTWYRTRRFLRRHWLPVAAAAFAMIGLSAGVLVANQERVIAQRRFVEVRQLANKLFDIDASARQLPGSTKTRQLIVDTSLNYLRRLSEDAATEPELALEVGNAYIRVARVQGVPISANLGQMSEAERNLRIGEKFVEQVLARGPGNRMALLRSAQIAHDRMLLARLNNGDEEALALARKSAGRLEEFRAGPADKLEAPAILLTYLNVASQEMLAGQYNEALVLCRRAAATARLFNSKHYLGTYLWVSADVFRKQGNLDGGLKDVRESVKILTPTNDHSEQGLMANFVLALIHEEKLLGEHNAISLGQNQPAVAIFQEAFNIAEKFVHQDRDDQNVRGLLASAGIPMAELLRESEPERSLVIYDHVLHHMAEITGNASFRLYEVSALAGSTYPLRRLGRSGETHQRLVAAFQKLQQVKAYPAEKIRPRSEADEALCALSDDAALRGAVPRAIEIREELLTKVLASHPQPEASLDDAVDMSRLYGVLAGLHRRSHHADVASALGLKRVKLWHHWNAKLPHNSFVTRQLEAAQPPLP